jgi:hypothetical protein
MWNEGALARMAAEHHGVFTLAEARERGVSSDALTQRLRRGLIQRREPGVYVFASAPTTWHQAVLVACRAEGGWASHRTAGVVWGLDGFRPGVIEVLTPRWKRRPNRSIRVHETRCFDRSDQAEVDGIPVTSVERTVADLGAVLPFDRVEMAMTDAINRRMTSPEALWVCLDCLDVPGRPWIAPLRRVVGPLVGGPVEVRSNRFEGRMTRVLVAAGLPAPDEQVEIRRPDGSLIGRVDHLYAHERIVIECDGAKHFAAARRRRDQRRDRELVALGYRVLRFGWEDLEADPEIVVRDVVGALAAASA